jgi:serine/threonine protein kinase
MGEVYRAKDTRLARDVAIKVLPSHLSSSAIDRQRFEREAKSISQLSHPHICALHDIGREGDIDYLVMEFLEGETLAERLVKGPLPVEDVLRYGADIADALDAAHRQGIVHRDLKPGNVMLTKSGVKLLDFGLAKALASVGSSPTVMTALPTEAAVTREGTILGTLQYMAPEQLEAKPADARTDIFALGCVLYEMATGKKSFSGVSQAALISAIMQSDPPPILSLQPMTPPALDRLVRRCLVKDPERRVQNARDVALELAEASVFPEREAAPVAPARRGNRLGWIAAGVFLALLLGSLFIPRHSPPVTPLPRLRLTIPPPAGAAVQGMLALSPDGRMLAFVATSADGNDLLYLRPLDSLESRVLPGTEGAALPFWSPDSRSIGFFAQSKLKRIDVAGGAPVTLCEALEPRGGSWGTRGVIVASVHTGGALVRVAEGGGLATSLLQLQPGASYRWPCFVPDGSHFLYYLFAESTKVPGLYVTSLESKETTYLAASDGGAVYAAPGYLLYRRGDRLVAQRFDANRRLLAGDPFPVVENIRWDGSATGATAASASNTGVLVCQTGGSVASRLLWYDRSGHELGSTGPDGTYWEPTLSPDGRSLAVPRMDREAVASSIWIMDLERGALTRISSQPVVASTPLWSADGRRVVYSAFPTGEVFVRDVRGAENEKLLFKATDFTPLDDWSRDERFLFHEVVNWPTFHIDVWVRDLQTGTSRPVLQAKFSQMGARLSPDGRWLAHESDESGTREIFVRSFPEATERRQVSIRGGTQARWRSDGRELFYVSADRKVMAVDIRTQPKFEADPPRALFQTRILPTIEARNHYDVTPDGKRFIVNSRLTGDDAVPITVVVGWTPEVK